MPAGPLQIVANTRYESSAYWHLAMRWPESWPAVQAGQFVMIRPGEIEAGPLMPRPFSVMDEANGVLHILYKVIGPGTEKIARLPAGASVSVLGPLGHGFPAPNSGATVIAVGGGFGLAPFRKAFRDWRATQPRRLVLCAGARTAADLPFLDDLEIAAAGGESRIATEDGSTGHRGLVTAIARAALADVDPAAAVLYACGPEGMLRAVQSLAAETGVSAWLSLEERMACGYGVCNGCVCATRPAPPQDAEQRQLSSDSVYSPQYLRICIDGPVLPADRIAFDGGG